MPQRVHLSLLLSPLEKHSGGLSSPRMLTHDSSAMCTWLSLHACWERRGISPKTLWNPDRYSLTCTPSSPPVLGVSTHGILMHTWPKLLSRGADTLVNTLVILFWIKRILHVIPGSNPRCLGIGWCWLWLFCTHFHISQGLPSFSTCHYSGWQRMKHKYRSKYHILHNFSAFLYQEINFSFCRGSGIQNSPKLGAMVNSEYCVWQSGCFSGISVCVHACCSIMC